MYVIHAWPKGMEPLLCSMRVTRGRLRPLRTAQDSAGPYLHGSVLVGTCMCK